MKKTENLFLRCVIAPSDQAPDESSPTGDPSAGEDDHDKGPEDSDDESFTVCLDTPVREDDYEETVSLPNVALDPSEDPLEEDKYLFWEEPMDHSQDVSFPPGAPGLFESEDNEEPTEPEEEDGHPRERPLVEEDPVICTRKQEEELSPDVFKDFEDFDEPEEGSMSDTNDEVPKDYLEDEPENEKDTADDQEDSDVADDISGESDAENVSDSIKSDSDTQPDEVQEEPVTCTTVPSEETSPDIFNNLFKNHDTVDEEDKSPNNEPEQDLSDQEDLSDDPNQSRV